MKSHLLQQVSELSLEEQLDLVGAIWDGIVRSSGGQPLTESQKTELDRLLAEHEANPQDVMSWDEVESAAIARLRQ